MQCLWEVFEKIPTGHRSLKIQSRGVVLLGFFEAAKIGFGNESPLRPLLRLTTPKVTPKLQSIVHGIRSWVIAWGF